MTQQQGSLIRQQMTYYPSSTDAHIPGGGQAGGG